MNSYNAIENGGEADFQKLAQTIATSIQKILQNVSSMQRMVNQFGTAQDFPELKQQLHQIRTYTQQLIKDTNNLLRDLGNSKDRHLRIQRERLVDEFTSALTAFQAVQRKTVDFEKNSVRQRQSTFIRPPPDSHSQKTGSARFNDDEKTALSFEDSFIDSSNRTQTQMQEEIDLQALEEQERAIRELEENIVDVNEIYKKLGAMVYEQGSMIDSIESNVESANVNVSSGTVQLAKASHYQNKLRKKKLYIALILAAIAAIIIVICLWNN